MRWLRIGAADVEFFHFKSAVVFDDGVKDLLHDVGIDEVSLGFNHFMEQIVTLNRRTHEGAILYRSNMGDSSLR